MLILLLAMMPFLILLAFIGWDRRRLNADRVKPISRERMEAGWSPQPSSNLLFFVGLAAVFAFMGALEWDSPTPPPYTGRHAWVKEIAYAAMGEHGTAYLLWVVSAFLVIVAFSIWASSSKRSDRNLP